MRDTRQPQIIAGRVDGSGGLVGCTDPRVTVVRNSLGNLTLTLPADFRPQGVSFTIIGGGSNGAMTNAGILNSMTVLTFNTSTGAAVDIAWSFVAVGAQT